MALSSLQTHPGKWLPKSFKFPKKSQRMTTIFRRVNQQDYSMGAHNVRRPATHTHTRLITLRIGLWVLADGLVPCTAKMTAEPFGKRSKPLARHGEREKRANLQGKWSDRELGKRLERNYSI